MWRESSLNENARHYSKTVLGFTMLPAMLPCNKRFGNHADLDSF